jgi:hypothetical protein
MLQLLEQVREHEPAIRVALELAWEPTVASFSHAEGNGAAFSYVSSCSEGVSEITSAASEVLSQHHVYKHTAHKAIEGWDLIKQGDRVLHAVCTTANASRELCVAMLLTSQGGDSGGLFASLLGAYGVYISYKDRAFAALKAMRASYMQLLDCLERFEVPPGVLPSSS